MPAQEVAAQCTQQQGAAVLAKFRTQVMVARRCIEDKFLHLDARGRSPKRQLFYQAASMGAGELVMRFRGVAPGVPPSPLSPLSLTALLSSFVFESALDPVESLLTSSGKLAWRGAALKLGTSQSTPVKLRILRPRFSHLRHLNFPVRSRARRF